MTTQYSLHRKPGTFDGPVPGNRLIGIGGASWIESTRRRKKRGNSKSIKTDD
jgi:hypothetical protein